MKAAKSVLEKVYKMAVTKAALMDAMMVGMTVGSMAVLTVAYLAG